MVKAKASICCASLVGLLAACGGAGPSSDQSETGGSSAIFEDAGAPNVAVGVSQTGAQPPEIVRLSRALAGIPSDPSAARLRAATR
jgi:hypothetical protein